MNKARREELRRVTQAAAAARALPDPVIGNLATSHQRAMILAKHEESKFLPGIEWAEALTPAGVLELLDALDEMEQRAERAEAHAVELNKYIAGEAVLHAELDELNDKLERAEAEVERLREYAYCDCGAERCTGPCSGHCDKDW